MYHLKRKLRIKQLLFVFCFLFWPLIGCDCGDGTGVGQAPVLEAAPDNLIFSAITLGESETKSFTIKSTGLSEVRISAIKIKVETGGTPYQIVDLDKITFPLILGPGEAKVLKVKYTPEKLVQPKGKCSSSAMPAIQKSMALSTSNYLQAMSVVGRQPHPILWILGPLPKVTPKPWKCLCLMEARPRLS
jgi:hypothetical protein